MTQIFPIQALQDNYIWLIAQNGHACCVDPGDASPVLEALKAHGLVLSSALITHHHWDHTGGLSELLDHYPNIQVFGPAHGKTKEVNQPVSDGQKIQLPNLDITLTAIEIPGHTLDHTAYFNDDWVFTGDTLFACGCGRVFEGTNEQMLASLKKLRNLNGNLKVYCGHEYTLDNLKFALTLEPNHSGLKARLHEMQALRDKNLPTLPVTLKDEILTNPFLRWDDKALIEAVKERCPSSPPEPLAIFSKVRAWKNEPKLLKEKQ